MRLAIKTINPTSRIHSASVIFFHGSGDTGPNLLEWVRFLLGKDMEFPHIKILYPTAPRQPYTPLFDEISNVWFNRLSISIDAPENRKSLAQIYESVHELINDEVNQGIPLNRIIVGGFSMGGALAMHTAFHLQTQLAGVFACSSFLNRNSIVYDSLKNLTNNNDSYVPELQMFHGDRDTLVPIDWANETFQSLTKLGVKGEFHKIPNTLHELKLKELVSLQNWILSKLPPETGDISNKL